MRVTGGFTVKSNTTPVFSRQKRYVIVANHQSMLDPFAIFALLPLRQRLRLLPLKFMTIPKVYHRWFLKPFCYILGCYPAHIRERYHHTYGVEGSIKLLNHGYNICIFPEGTRTLQRDSDPKMGIVRILEAHPGATLILAHIEWTFTKRGGRHLTMVVAPAPQNLDKTNPKTIMNAIYAL
jgi:1-acyl-sn-glycerol-3-phosphate acyltransferase